MATGMALMGLRPVIEMQFADFISSAFDSIVQFAATAHYRGLGAVPWVIRAPSDGGLRSGPFHSQNPEAWFVHTPGLKVVAPGTPADAKGLLIAAIRDNNPVIYFESKPLYRTMKGQVPAGDYVVPIGRRQPRAARRRAVDHHLRRAAARGARGRRAAGRRGRRVRRARPAHAQAARRRRDPDDRAEDRQGARRPLRPTSSPASAPRWRR